MTERTMAAKETARATIAAKEAEEGLLHRVRLLELLRRELKFESPFLKAESNVRRGRTVNPSSLQENVKTGIQRMNGELFRIAGRPSETRLELRPEAVAVRVAVRKEKGRTKSRPWKKEAKLRRRLRLKRKRRPKPKPKRKRKPSREVSAQALNRGIRSLKS